MIHAISNDRYANFLNNNFLIQVRYVREDANRLIRAFRIMDMPFMSKISFKMILRAVRSILSVKRFRSFVLRRDDICTSIPFPIVIISSVNVRESFPTAIKRNASVLMLHRIRQNDVVSPEVEANEGQ